MKSQKKAIRECVELLFDNLCESDGFHQDDEMPSEFIEGIMANEQHAEAIKTRIESQMQKDVKKCPKLFNFKDGWLMYDGDMREDYEGIATQYCREIFNVDKKKSLWLCPHCGSDNVETKMWVNPNTNTIGDCDAGEDGDGWCNDCEQHGELILQELPVSKKVVGFQVVGIEGTAQEDNINPLMAGSFCLYNRSQANEMLEKSNTTFVNWCWKLLTIWSGDVEEPTLMFEGDPRD
jgi:hypothetical protein